MIKKIKGVAALLLLVCLFLPLSQCTKAPTPVDPDQTVKVYKYYAAQDDNFWTYLPAIPFVLPLLMVLFNINVKREKLRYELVDVILGLMVLSVVLIHAFIANLILGGYLALVGAVSYLLASLIESGKTIRYRYRNRQTC